MVAEKRNPRSCIPNTDEKKNEKTKKKKKKGKKKRRKKKKKKKKGKERNLLEGAPLESFELEVRHTPLTPLLHLREGASPQLRRGAATKHHVRTLRSPFITMVEPTPDAARV